MTVKKYSMQVHIICIIECCGLKKKVTISKWCIVLETSVVYAVDYAQAPDFFHVLSERFPLPLYFFPFLKFLYLYLSSIFNSNKYFLCYQYQRHCNQTIVHK